MESYKAVLRSKENGSNKTLLKKGFVPGIIYGKGSDPTKIAFEKMARELTLTFHRIQSLFEETNGPSSVGPLLDYMAKVELDDVTTSDLAGKTERDAMQEEVEETEDNNNAMVVDNAKSVVVGGRRKKKTRRKKRKEGKEHEEEKINFLSIIVNEILYSGKYIIYSS